MLSDCSYIPVNETLTDSMCYTFNVTLPELDYENKSHKYQSWTLPGTDSLCLTTTNKSNIML